MNEVIYPKEQTKIIEIPKQGYNSLSVLNETPDVFIVQLYNPNVEPVVEDTDDEKHED